MQAGPIIVALLALLAIGSANKVLPTQSANEITAIFAPVREFVLTHVTEFDESEINEIMKQLRLKTQVSEDTWELHPGLVAMIKNAKQDPRDWERAFSFETMIAPYTKPGKDPMAVFLDRIIELNRASPAIVNMLVHINKVPVSKWLTLMQANLMEVDMSSPRECLQHNDIVRALVQGFHACLIYDSLTNLLFENPTTYLDVMDEYYSLLFPALEVSGASAFWLVKFPSVRVPIKEFVKESLKAAQAEEIARLEEDDEELINFRERLARGTLNLVSYFISEDPTTALRQNIVEACVAETVYLRHHKKETDNIPPNAYGGLVLQADKMYGQLHSCGASCRAHFPKGQFIFSDSASWMHLYSAWNLAFTMSSGEIFEWWAKLLTPAVLSDTTGKQYIIRRAIALWLALNRSGFKLDEVNKKLAQRNRQKQEEEDEIMLSNGASNYLLSAIGPGLDFDDEETEARYRALSRYDTLATSDDCRNPYSFVPLYSTQYLFGEQVKEFAQRYVAKMWPRVSSNPNTPSSHKNLASSTANLVSVVSKMKAVSCLF